MMMDLNTLPPEAFELILSLSLTLFHSVDRPEFFKGSP